MFACKTVYLFLDEKISLRLYHCIDCYCVIKIKIFKKTLTGVITTITHFDINTLHNIDEFKTTRVITLCYRHLFCLTESEYPILRWSKSEDTVINKLSEFCLSRIRPSVVHKNS